MFIWLSNAFLVLLTLAIVYWKPWLILINFAAYCFNYYLLANSFNKKIFAHSEGKFVYRNVFRRRLSFNFEDIVQIDQTTIRKGIVLKLKDNKGFVYLTPYWKNWQYLFRFVLNGVNQDVIKNKEKIFKSLNL